MVAAVEPVVVFLGERAGRARGREHLFEPREILRTIRQRRPGLRSELICAPAKARPPDLRVFRRNEEALRDRADKEGRILRPCDRTEVVAGRAGLAVRAEEGIHRPREGGIACAELVYRRAAADRIGDDRRSSHGLGEGEEVFLQLLERDGETLREGERIRL